MSRRDNVEHATSARSRAIAGALIAFAVALVGYAAWRGYQNPDLVLRVGAALGLC
jgi:hypothetical protein